MKPAPYLNNNHAILPVGSVNLKTGANREYGNIWDLWNMGEGTYVLVSSVPFGLQEAKYRAVITADTLENATQDYPKGSQLRFYHDQTGNGIGYLWTIVGCFPNTPQGLIEMQKLCHKLAIPFATFK